MSSFETSVPAKHYAALYVALGWLRSELINIQGGELDMNRINRLIDASTTGHIEAVCGLPRDSLFIDFHQHISDREKHLIGASGSEIDDEKDGYQSLRKFVHISG
jgi:hypothetical protein